MGGLAVKPQRIGRADQLAVERPGFLHAAHFADEAQATIGGGLAHPAAFGLIGDDVEAAGDVGRGIGRLLRARQHFGVQHAGNCRLLDQRARIACMQRIERGAHGQRFLDDAAKIGAGTFRAVRQNERGVLQAGIDEIVLQRLPVLEVLLRGTALHLVEWRLGDVEVPALDHLRHLPVEEGEQQRANMGAVDVGVGHDDDLVVAQLVDVEFLAADAGAQGRDKGSDLGGTQHLVEAGALDVEDLATQWQHRLVLTVAGLLGGAAGRVTLDDEDFGLRRVALLAVGKLAGKRGDIEGTLAPRELARLARGLAGGGGLDHLGDDGARLGGMLLEPCAKLLVDEVLDHRTDFR